jgi:hypothetical protein
MRKLLAIDSTLGGFLLSLTVYFAQVVEGIWLIARPGSNEIVFILAYTLFGSMALSLRRAWMLLQPGHRDSDKPVRAAPLAQPTQPSELTGNVR